MVICHGRKMYKVKNNLKQIQEYIYVTSKEGTPRKINMEPENTPLEKENHLPNHHFQVIC